MQNTSEIQDAAERFLRKHHPVSRARCAAQHDDSLWQGIAEQGWPSMLVPTSMGGLDMGMQAACEVAQMAGKFLLSLPLAANMAVLPTVCVEAPEVMADLQALMHGRHGFAWGDADPHGSTWIEGAHMQRDIWMMCDDSLLRLPPVAGSLGFDPTMSVARLRSIHPSERIGLSASGALRTLQGLRTLRLAETLGTAIAALWLAVAHAKERQQFGKPIGANQAVKHKLADCWMALDDATLALQAVAQGWDNMAADVADRLDIAQWLVVDGSLRTVQQAVQTHGALGITWECDVHLYLKRVLRVTSLLQLHATQAALLERIWNQRHQTACVRYV